MSKGHNSIKNVGGVTFLFSAHRLMVVCICTKFHEIILNGVKVLGQTKFSMEKIQRGIILEKRSRWSYGSFSLHIV